MQITITTPNPNLLRRDRQGSGFRAGSGRHGRRRARGGLGRALGGRGGGDARWRGGALVDAEGAAAGERLVVVGPVCVRIK